MPEEPWAIALLVLAALVAINLALGLLFWAFSGAVIILGRAAEQGFIGVAAYGACWIFAFPVMLTISIIVGIVCMWLDKRDQWRAGSLE